MGLGFVLIIWSFLGSVVAVVGSKLLPPPVLQFVHGSDLLQRDLLRRYLKFLPIGLALYCFVALIGYGVWSESRGGDFAGLGDSASCRLPNGYRLVFIDGDEPGYLLAPGNENISSDGVDRLQLHGDFLYAAIHEESSDFHGHGRFFKLDTKTGRRAWVDSVQSLQQVAAADHGVLDLKPAIEIYQSTRYDRRDVFLLALLSTPPLASILYLVIWISRLRRPIM